MSRDLLVNSFVFGSIIFLLYIGESIGPNKVGFFCDDSSIRMPHYPQTIDFRLLLFIIFTVPTLFFGLLDRSDFKYQMRNYYYGILMNILITQYCKLVIGRPRPNFYSICKPDVQCGLDEKRFVTNYTCTNDKRWLVNNSNQSFYSGHSSLGTYAAFFLIFYLNDKLKINGLLKAHLIFFIFMAGLLPGLTQYLRFWHFFSDVLIGDTFGILLALFIYYGIKSLEKQSNLIVKNLKTSS